MLADYQKHVKERAKQNLPPLPLDEIQTNNLINIIKNPNKLSDSDKKLCLELLTNRIPPGVDKASFVKANFLADIAKENIKSNILTAVRAVELLGTMLGGFNINPLIDLLSTDNDKTAIAATAALKNITLVYNSYDDIKNLADNNNKYAKEIINSWAEAEWFSNKPPLAKKIVVKVFKVDGETNTDDLSPAQSAWSRPDIPLHATEMLKNKLKNADKILKEIKQDGIPLAYVGDIVGTGSSRKSAINSIVWHFGEEIPYTPNKKRGGIVIGSKIAPIFFNTAQDSGVLPIECDVSAMSMGDIINIYPYQGRITDANDNLICEYKINPNTILDEMQAGGRIPLIIGRSLTDKTRADLGLNSSTIFIRPQNSKDNNYGFTLAQKIVGKACGVDGIKPGVYCEPRMSTVGSQDTTGAMTRDELKELACLGFNADFVLQSFCHTAAYPKQIDIELQHSLPEFINSRGGMTLKPGDGIIHSWLNRMLLPDTVGTGGDSHTRFPIGISFPAGSGLVAFAATLGVMPLNMPESVLVRFKGKMQPGITLRDLVNAIPYKALKMGLLTLEKRNKKNIFNGRILEIEGLEDLKIEQAFELSDASAERSANGCAIKLNRKPIKEYLQSNIALIDWMIANGYQNANTLKKRKTAMQDWIKNPKLLEADKNANYTAVIEIDLQEITEPLIACPNDPDAIKPLSEIAKNKIDEVFIGSCMTNIGHYRAAAKLLENTSSIPTRLWIAPPTKMDERQLIEEGYYSIFGKVGARTELPGCSLCMGNQARVLENSAVFSTSTRNFPNRMGKNANVYLGSAELAAVCATLGRIPTQKEYLEQFNLIQNKAQQLYRYLQFDQMPSYSQNSKNLQDISVIQA